jgi:hypothetical protein
MTDTRNNYRAVPIRSDPNVFRIEYRPFWWPFWFTTWEYAESVERAHMKAERHAEKSAKPKVFFNGGTVYLGRKP